MPKFFDLESMNAYCESTKKVEAIANDIHIAEIISAYAEAQKSFLEADKELQESGKINNIKKIIETSNTFERRIREIMQGNQYVK